MIRWFFYDARDHEENREMAFEVDLDLQPLVPCRFLRKCAA